MGIEFQNKTSPQVIIDSAGTALGTSSIFDSTGWKQMQVMSIHGGTGGSRTIIVYVNGGTQKGTSNVTFPNPLQVGTANSDYAGLGDVVWQCGSLTDQFIVTYGTSTNLGYSCSVMFYDE